MHSFNKNILIISLFYFAVLQTIPFLLAQTPLNPNQNRRLDFYTTALELPDLSPLLSTEAYLSHTNSEQWIINELSALDRAYSGSHINFYRYIHERSHQLMNEYLQNYFKNQFINMANRYGTINLDLMINHNWEVGEDFQLDYLVPIIDINLLGKHNLFSQMGYRKYYRRPYVNLGLGFRTVIAKGFMFGINTFYDYDLVATHQRISAGLELATNSWRFSSNYYYPVSGIEKQPIESPEFRFKAKPAKGYDVNFTGWLSPENAVAATVGFHRWQGNMVDPFSSFHTLASREKPFINLSKHPKSLHFDLNWQLFPAFGTTIKYSRTFDDKTDISGHFDMTINMDQSLSEQLSPKAVKEGRMLKGIDHTLVKRQSYITLDYEKPSANQTLTLNISIQMVELDTHQLIPNIEASLPIKIFLWTGSIVPLLSSTVVERPTINVPRYNINQYKYDAQLEIIDILGRKYKSNVAQLEIIKNSQLKHKIFTFTDSTLIHPISVYKEAMGSPGSQIFWKIVWGNKINLLPSQIATQWQKSSIFVDETVTNPKINTINAINTYTAVLKVDDPAEGQLSLQVPIEITKSLGISVIWDSTEAKSSLVQTEFSPGKTLKQTAQADPSSTLPPSTSTIQYKTKSGGKNICDIDGMGNITLHNSGQETIYAILPEDKNHQKSSNNFVLEVSKNKNVDLDWNPPVTANRFSFVFKSKPEFITTASSSTGGVITYSLDSAATNYVNLMPKTGTIIPTGAGSTGNVIATRQADSNYEEKTISYNLIIDKAATTSLSWKPGKINAQGKYLETYAKNKQYKIEAIRTLNTTNVTYSSSNSAVAAANLQQDGTIDIKTVGNSNISAFQSGDADHQDTTINYTLQVGPGKNTAFAWDPNEVPASNTVVKLFIPNSTFTIQAQAGDSTGAITYSVDNPPAPPLALDLPDQTTGQLKILNCGTAIVWAHQAKTANYEASKISYTATIEKNDSLLTWDKSLVTANKLNSPLKIGDQITIALTSQAGSTGQISYTVESGGISHLGSGKIKADTSSTFKVRGDITEDSNYKADHIFYTGNVLFKKSGLHWDPAVPSSYQAETLSVFTLNAINDKNKNPPSYAIVSNMAKASLQPANSSTVKTDQFETVVIEARIKSDGIYEDETIDYTLDVVRKDDNSFQWDDADAQNGLISLVFGSTQANSLKKSASSSLSAGQISYTFSNTTSPEAIKSINSNGAINLVAAGSATVNANLAKNDYYLAKTKRFVLNIDKCTPIITWNPKNVDTSKVDPAIKQTVVEGDIFSVSVNNSTSATTQYGVESGGSTIVYNSTLQNFQATSYGAFKLKAFTTENDQCKATTPIICSGYALKKDSGLSWDDPSGIIVNDQYSTNTLISYQIDAKPGTNTTGIITYNLQNILGNNVATLVNNKSGLIKTNEAGKVKVAATQASDGRHVSQTISYELEVKKRATTLKWDPISPLQGAIGNQYYDAKVTDGSVNNIQAIDDEVTLGAEGVIYSIVSGGNVSISSVTGEITLGANGLAIIQAQQQANKYFNTTQIQYTLNVWDNAKFSSTKCDFYDANKWHACPKDPVSQVPSIFESKNFLLSVTSNNTDQPIIFSSKDPLIAIQQDGNGSGLSQGNAAYVISQNKSHAQYINQGSITRKLIIKEYKKPVIAVKAGKMISQCTAYKTNNVNGLLGENIYFYLSIDDPAKLLDTTSIEVYAVMNNGYTPLANTSISNPKSDDWIIINATGKAHYFNDKVLIYFKYKLITGESIHDKSANFIPDNEKFICPAIN